MTMTSSAPMRLRVAATIALFSVACAREARIGDEGDEHTRSGAEPAAAAAAAAACTDELACSSESDAAVVPADDPPVDTQIVPPQGDSSVPTAAADAAAPLLPEGSVEPSPAPETDASTDPQKACALLQQLTLSEPTLAPSLQDAHQPWPQDGRLAIFAAGGAFKLGIRVTNDSDIALSTVAVWLECSNVERVWNGGAVWFKSLAPKATQEASVTVQRGPGEMSCTWHKMMGPAPLRGEGCVVDAWDVRLSLVAMQ